MMKLSITPEEFEQRFGLKWLTEEELEAQEKQQKEKEELGFKEYMIHKKLEQAGFTEFYRQKLWEAWGQTKGAEKIFCYPGQTIVTGPFGVGKTFGAGLSLLSILSEMSLDQLRYFRIQYLTFLSVFEAKYQNMEFYQQLKTVNLLIIDEFLTLGTYNRQDTDVVLHDILDSRMMAGLSTVFITNIRQDMIHELVEGGIVSRLKEFQWRILTGKDKRGQNAVMPDPLRVLQQGISSQELASQGLASKGFTSQGFAPQEFL